MRWNIWDCEICGGPNLYHELDKGVTPYMLRCRVTKGCPGMARSRFYPNGDPPDRLEPIGVWRKPTPQEIKRASKAMREHYEMGGLFQELFPQ